MQSHANPSPPKFPANREICRFLNRTIFETYGGDDPLGYVVSLNLKRRHLDTSQRVMAAAKLATLKQGQKANTAIAVSQEAAAKSLNVSVDSVQRARFIVASAQC